MVFYFTATGNSLYVAKHLDTELISIPQEMNKTDRNYKADKIGIVCPLFELDLPDLIKDFIRSSTFETEYFYIIVTYGMHHGGVAERAQEFLESIGKKADYINTIIMLDNAIIVFDMDQQKLLEPEKKVDEHIAMLKADIDACKHEIQFAAEEEKTFYQGFMKMTEEYGRMYSFPLYGVTDACVGCGTCTRVCPRGCIRVENSRPVYDYTHCVNCMACAHACPQNAIKLVCVKEPNPNARYRNPNISLAEIIQANQQK